MAISIAVCKHCKGEFETYRKNPIYCSIACRNKGVDFKISVGYDVFINCCHCNQPQRKAQIARHERICLSYNKECKLCKKTWRADKDSVKNSFCSRSCSTTYNNSHKQKGIRRSKLELFLEERLSVLYPQLNISFNKIHDLGFELDIFIPSLKLAFEINGIVHYKNIYGQEKYERIKNNDRNKMVKCHENDIVLVVLDTLEQHRFSEESSTVYLDTICKMIESTLNKTKKTKKKPS